MPRRNLNRRRLRAENAAKGLCNKKCTLREYRSFKHAGTQQSLPPWAFWRPLLDACSMPRTSSHASCAGRLAGLTACSSNASAVRLHCAASSHSSQCALGARCCLCCAAPRRHPLSPPAVPAPCWCSSYRPPALKLGMGGRSSMRARSGVPLPAGRRCGGRSWGPASGRGRRLSRWLQTAAAPRALVAGTSANSLRSCMAA